MTDDRCCDLLCLDLERAEAIRGRMDAEATRRTARRAKLLGDETRLTLAMALAEAEELCVCDLSWIAGRAENLVSHHLRALRAEGLASNRREGKMAFYALTPEGRRLLQAVSNEELAR